MADPRRRHQANVAGPWFVDTTCIDCDACRQIAPAVFDGTGLSQSAVRRQPVSADEEKAATRALVACPTASIGVEGRHVQAEGLFPQEIAANHRDDGRSEDGVFYCGYNSEDSFGANAFLAVRREGNLLVDSPRFAAPLVHAIEAKGGVRHVLLTHRDDVADAERFARHFGAEVWIHEADAAGAPFATHLLRGRESVPLWPDLMAIPLPGHTRGSVAYLLRSRFLFSGDSLYWSRARQDLSAFRDACWYSWEEQTESLDRLSGHRFQWVLAGHGDRHGAPADEMDRRLRALVQRMRGTDFTGEW